MTKKDKENFKNASICYACHKKFRNEYSVKYYKSGDFVKIFSKSNKVADHCHFTGIYRGAACQTCNSKMKNPKFFPVLFHNLEKYDSHLFINALGFEEGEIKVIAKTEQRYISFSKEIIVDQFYSKKDKKNCFCKKRD